ncbi:glycosyltransferase family 4 protein [Marinobacter salinexigens]|nr:glycosyltransferase family 4 protein [Marinobacter salinexigens]
MRIAIYSDCNSRGGVWAYSIRTIIMLKRLGYKVYLVSHKPRNDVEESLLNDLGRDVDSSLILSRDLGEKSLANDICKFLLLNDIDAFIPNYRRISYYAAAKATRFKRIDIIGVCHNDHESYYSVLIRFQNIVSVFICASSKTSRVLSAKLSERNRDKVFLIPHYISKKPLEKTRYKKEEFTVVYHGRIQEEQKNCSKIIEIASLVCREECNIRFLLIGDSNDSGFYRRLIEQNGISDQVKLLPGAPWEEIKLILSGSQVALLTSSYEGFCYGAAEALACGVPVGAYDCGEVIKDFLVTGKNGLLVGWGESRKLANWILELYHDEAEWRRLSDGAYDISNDYFSFDRISQKYKKAIGGSIHSGSKWPLIRPLFIPEKGRSIRSFIDRQGRRFGVWP